MTSQLEKAYERLDYCRAQVRRDPSHGNLCDYERAVKRVETLTQRESREMASQWTIDRAMKVYDGMEQIVANEMLKQGQYIFQDIDKKLAAQGAICGGHKVCLMGSMWVASGVKVHRENYGYGYGEEVKLPGVDIGSARDRFMKTRPVLRLAYDSLNEAAEQRIARMRVFPEEWCSSPFPPAEKLFETGALKNRRDILRLITSARKIAQSKLD